MPRATPRSRPASAPRRPRSRLRSRCRRTCRAAARGSPRPRRRPPRPRGFRAHRPRADGCGTRQRRRRRRPPRRRPAPPVSAAGENVAGLRAPFRQPCTIMMRASPPPRGRASRPPCCPHARAADCAGNGKVAGMIYEMRVYRCLPGWLPALLHPLRASPRSKIWERHGIRQAGFWTTLVGGSTTNSPTCSDWHFMAEREPHLDRLHGRQRMDREARRLRARPARS